MTGSVDELGPSEAPESGPSNYVGLVVDDRYQVLRHLGSGGMGQIVLARHQGLKRLVAIKFLERLQVEEPGATQRLFREAQAAAAIGHPNIVEVLDVGTAPWGEPYLVMEYLEGEDLSTFTDREGSLSAPEALFVIEAVLQGLGAAHALGIVHRDLKPQNIVLCRKRGELIVKVIDFGVAKVSAPGITPLTKSGELVGTPSFMSPEQAKGEDVDARSDVFCVGVLLHRLLAGKNPFSAANYHSLLHLIATGEPDLARDVLQSDMREFIERCLSKEPLGRFQTCDEALAALSQIGGWEARNESRRTLALRLRSVDAEPDTVVDRAWTPSGERATSPRPKSVADLAPSSAVVDLEPTLAAAPPSSSTASLRPSRGWSRWAPWVVLSAVAFGGGWWAANSREERSVPPPRVELSVPNELQIGRNATVKLYPAYPSGSAVASTTIPTASSPSGVVGPAIHPARPPSPPALGSGPANSGPSSAGVPSVHSTPLGHNPEAAGTVEPSASAPAPLGKAGKNSFFSEVFE